MIGIVADVVLIHASTELVVVAPAGFSANVPHTSQSPAVSDIDVMSAAVAEVIDTAAPANTVDEMNCPILPAEALSFVAVPCIWPAQMSPTIRQLPAPSDLSFSTMPATVVIFNPLGVMIDELAVSVSAPWNSSVLSVPDCTVSNAVIVVLPEMNM